MASEFGGGSEDRARAARANRRRFQSIPMPTHIDNETRKILVAIIDVVERRLLGIGRKTPSTNSRISTRTVESRNEKMMSRADLVKLGIVTQAQVDSLDRTDQETGA